MSSLTHGCQSANSNKKSRKVGFEDDESADYFASKMKSTQDHITALGFVNDGYDYSQHLKEMG